MNFEYNGNLLEEDRIQQVVNEIIQKYPQVSMDRAREVAMLEGRISANKTVNDELNRLYNLMLVYNDNKAMVSFFYTDYMHLLENTNLEKIGLFVFLANGVRDYLQGYTDFPFLSDYQA